MRGLNEVGAVGPYMRITIWGMDSRIGTLRDCRRTEYDPENACSEAIEMPRHELYTTIGLC